MAKRVMRFLAVPKCVMARKGWRVALLVAWMIDKRQFQRALAKREATRDLGWHIDTVRRYWSTALAEFKVIVSDYGFKFPPIKYDPTRPGRPKKNGRSNRPISKKGGAKTDQ